MGKIINFIEDLVFPKFCVGCSKEGDWLCQKCAGDIIPVVSQVCPKCTRLSENGRYHEKCQKAHPQRLNSRQASDGGRGNSLKGIIAAVYYEEGPVKEMVHNFKYNGVQELAEPLGKLMANSLNNELRITNNGKTSRQAHDSSFMLRDSTLVPVPLHWRRQAERGYNQSELLAREISKHANLPVIDVLTKVRQTKRQAGLGGEERRKNLEKVFRIKKQVFSIKNKTIILVDDVYTTGSTLNECARGLKSAGAKEVWGLVVARG